MTDQTLPAENLPSGGGSYIREKDGSLTMVEPPTAEGYRLAVRAAAAEAPVEAQVEASVQEDAEPAFKSRRTAVKEA
jgi:hypothetical protein